MQAAPREIPYPHKQHSLSATRETLASQSSPSLNSKGKIEESHAAHGVVDKAKLVGKSGSASSIQAMDCENT